MDNEDDLDHLTEVVRRSARDGIWITRDGEVIMVEEMEDRHLMNARRVLSEWLAKEVRPAVRRDLKSWQWRFKRELTKREALPAAKIPGGKIPSRPFSRKSPAGTPPRT